MTTIYIHSGAKLIEANSPRRQAGYATLGIGVILLLILSLMTVYLTKSGILDIRTSADKTRYSQSLAEAEKIVEIGVGWMTVQANRDTIARPWTSGEDIDSGDTRTSAGRIYQATTSGTTGATAPTHTSGTASDGGVTWQYVSAIASGSGWATCNNATLPTASGTEDLPTAIQALGNAWYCRSQDVTYTDDTGSRTDTFFLATPVADPNSLFYILAVGTSDDNTASTVVKQGLFFSGGVFPASSGGPPPMMGAGNIPLNGNFNVVANPNGGGQGVPVSIWSKITIDAPQGASATCQIEEYERAGGSCGSSPISQKDIKGPDIVDGDADNFPDDMFQYVFGLSASSYNLVKSQATVITSCSGLNASSSGLYWATTNECQIPANTTVGSRDNPVILVVETVDFRMNANSTFYGVLFAFDPNENAGTMTMNGGATVYGSVLSNDSLSMGININGTFNMIYDIPTMDAFDPDGEDPPFRLISKMPGSWADYLQ